MFGFRKALQQRIEDLSHELATEKGISDALDKSAAKFKRERDDARLALGGVEKQLGDAQAKIARMTGGLKQNRKPASNAYPIPGSAADVPPPTLHTIS